jgi:thioredoxin 1
VARKLIKYGAEWCHMCFVVDPVAQKLADLYGIELERREVDEDPEGAYEHGIRALPTIILEEDGQEVARTTGAKVIAALERELGLSPLERPKPKP